ncbi:MAG: DNA methyltransferase [Candidatus Zixiibacteriota bacterium]
MIAKPRLKLVNNTGSVQEEIDRQRGREPAKKKPVAPLASPVLALSHTPIYKMHRYYARRPHNVFAKLIQHYTSPGDLILDPFCGGGVTVVEALKLRRRVIGVDLNPLATWVTKMEVSPADREALIEVFERWAEWMEKEIGPMYAARCGHCGKSGRAEWFEWSNVVICPDCHARIVLGSAKKVRGGVYECGKCKTRVTADKAERRADRMLSVLVHCPHCERRELRNAELPDTRRAARFAREFDAIVKQERLKIPDDPFPDANSVRENNLFAKGFLKFSDYFTARNLIANARLKKWLTATRMTAAVRDHLFHVFSASLRFTNKMVIRSEAWRGDKPLEWAGHVYWPAYTYLEASPLEPIRKRFKALLAGKEEQEETIGDFARIGNDRSRFTELQEAMTCWLLTRSSHKLPIPDHSVDAIITDPPFGGNVQYAELSDFYLVWLKEQLGLKGIIDTKHEAIETRHSCFEGAKDRTFYEEMLHRIFTECRRVLKPDGWMVMTFHNRDIGVWMALNRAAIRAGFRLPPDDVSANRGMVYQPPIENYTQTIHQKRAGSMLGDFILSFEPKDGTAALGELRDTLSTSEQDALITEARKLIEFHGGADETTLMTGLIPFLSQQGLLARLAKFDFRILFNAEFSFVKSEKKWYTPSMVDADARPLKTMDYVPAQHQTEVIIHEYLLEKKRARLDDLLIEIYSRLVNSHRPQMQTIEAVVQRCCRKVKVKGEKRDFFEWKPQVLPQMERELAKARQGRLFDAPQLTGHTDIIRFVADAAAEIGLAVQIGETERRKDESLRALSVALKGVDLGLPPNVFRILKEIDLLILRENVLVAGLEIVISMGTLAHAMARFQNLFVAAPNLDIKAVIVCQDQDYDLARRQLDTPANRKSALSRRVAIWPISRLDRKSLQELIQPTA